MFVDIVMHLLVISICMNIIIFSISEKYYVTL